MDDKEKFLITSEGRFDAGTVNWDDPLFTDLLIRSQSINTDQARGIGRFVREAIARMEVQAIPVSVIEKLIEDKLMEYGLTKPAPVKLDKALFAKNALALSENALTVLKRRYLKKDSQGKLIETPEKMFRRVAQHIAKAEKNYGADDARVKDVEDDLLQPHDPVRLSAQLAHADERRPAPGPARGLLRAAGRRHAWRASSVRCATPP